jgi:RHS repeat-associated protein
MFGATSGYRNDGDAGLMQVGVRYYDAQVGRFTSRDTYLEEHPYLYCDHDPVNCTDPNGHQRTKKGHKGHKPPTAPSYTYPAGWPKTIPINFSGPKQKTTVKGNVTTPIANGGAEHSTESGGQTYPFYGPGEWKHVPPAMQKTMTFMQFVNFIKQHEK